MDTQRIIHAAMEYIETLFAGDFSGHDAAHSLRVYRNTCLIADAEPTCDRFIVSLAALLHDADDHKLFHTENNANARAFLTAHAVSPAQVEAICQVINGVSFSKNRGIRPQTLEGQIVQDADRLDALGAVGIARTFAYGGAKHRSLTNSLSHFDEKLLLLYDLLSTEEARRIALPRHEFLKAFYARFREEAAMAASLDS